MQHASETERLAMAQQNNTTRNITVAITGASGAVFARAMLQTLASDSRVGTVNLVCSDNALRVMAEELGLQGRSNFVSQLIPENASKFQLQNNADIGANIASGSYPVDAMIVIPCSMGTLAKIANGLATHLIERAADVMLKERRQLVLCVRETPLNKVHLRNMSLAADAGATIYPLIPTYYNLAPDFPDSSVLDTMAREFANRVLKHIGLSQPDAYVWKG